METDGRPFAHSPLDPGNRQIRLVTLRAGSFNDPIRCHLRVEHCDPKVEHCDLKVEHYDDERLPPYEALSYVWGDTRDRRRIELNHQPFEVTANLWMVLRRLRDPGTDRVLWIDAICIDQGNHDEKAHQVNMMREIYRRCKKAILWLGEDPSLAETGSTSTTAHDACELLKIFASDRHFNELPCFSPGEGMRLEISEQYTNAFQALGLLVSAPWWRRIWVVQEMVLPRKIQFLYASEEFCYETLRSVARVLDTHATTCCKSLRMGLRTPAFDPLMVFQEQVEPMVYTRDTWARKTPTTLFTLRRRFSAFQATEKRDLFYALLGLVTSWGPSTPLEPNYEVSLKDAITTAVFKCISEHGDIGFLQGSRQFRSATDIPTWVPDANFTSIPSQWVLVEQRRLRMASGFSASASVRQDASKLTLAANGTLLLQSLMVDKIAAVGAVSQAHERLERTPRNLRAWMEMAGVGVEDWPERPPQRGSQAEAFWRTILNDSVELDTNKSPFYRQANEKDYLHLRDLWATVLSFQPFREGFDLSACEAVYETVHRRSPTTTYHLLFCLWKRRMVVTERGLIGLAPASAEPGDEVHIPLGSPVPFFLRPFKMESHPEPVPSYKVVGNGYVHEFMFGKAFEGESSKNIGTVALH